MIERRTGSALMTRAKRRREKTVEQDRTGQDRVRLETRRTLSFLFLRRAADESEERTARILRAISKDPHFLLNGHIEDFELHNKSPNVDIDVFTGCVWMGTNSCITWSQSFLISGKIFTRRPFSVCK